MNYLVQIQEIGINIFIGNLIIFKLMQYAVWLLKKCLFYFQLPIHFFNAET